MGILKDGIQFTGKVGNLSAYRLKGTDKIVIRRKGGATKEQIANSPNFIRTRENNLEFGACGATAGQIRRIMFPVNHVADYNFVSTLTSLMKKMQTHDNIGGRGKRGLFFSQYGALLTGFQLNSKTSFDSMVRQPVTCTIDRANATGIVQLPDLIPGLTLQLPPLPRLYRFVAGMGVIADREFNGKDYKDLKQRPLPAAFSDVTAWHGSQENFKAQQITLKLQQPKNKSWNKNVTFLLYVGLELGELLTATEITPVKWLGCAQIAAVS